MPWWITVPAVLAVVIAVLYGVLAVWLWWNEPRVAVALVARRIAAEALAAERIAAEAGEREAPAHA